MPEVRITGRSGSAQIYPPLTMLGDQEGSIVSNQDLSHGPQPRKPHSRARLRDLDRTWLCARPSRSALACGRAGNLGGIDGRARPRTRPAKEATVACTIEDHQDPQRGNTSAQTPSARGSRNKSFLLARRTSQI